MKKQNEAESSVSDEQRRLKHCLDEVRLHKLSQSASHALPQKFPFVLKDKIE